MNQKGFSLVQVIIAGAIAAGIGLYIARMSQNANQSALGFRQQIAIAFMKKEIMEIMSNDKSCFQTLTQRGSNSSVAIGDTFDEIVIARENPSNPSGPPTVINAYRTNTSYEGVEITSIYLNDRRWDGDTVLDRDQGEGMWLVVALDKQMRAGNSIGGGRSFGAQNQNIYVKVMDVRENNGDLKSCASGDTVDLIKRVCRGYGAIYDDTEKTCEIIGIDGRIECTGLTMFRGIEIAIVNGEKVYKPICQ